MASDFKSKQVIYEYVGRGSYVMGVPMRDLTEDEWKALDTLDRKTAKLLYKRMEVAEKVEVTEKAEVKNGSNKS